MIYIRLIDGNGLFIGDSFVEEITEFTIETPCPSGFYRPKWNGTEWIEGMAHEYIDSLKSEPQEPSESERLEALEMLMVDILGGGF